ncbi:MAG: DUF4157 domain-containing protein [Myxococcota bacterium]
MYPQNIRIDRSEDDRSEDEQSEDEQSEDEQSERQQPMRSDPEKGRRIMAWKMHGQPSVEQVEDTAVRSCPSYGEPLPDDLRRCAQELFGEDLSDVRVFISNAAEKIGARAFTVGSQLHFAPGAYDPHTPAGVRLLGHEIAHVLQQRHGRVESPYGYGVVIVNDPVLEEEAERMGAALQMMRDKIDVYPNYMIVPQNDAVTRIIQEYVGHVETRTTHFISLLFAGALCYLCAGGDRSKLGAIYSDTAEAQAGTGVRIQGNDVMEKQSYDAAHFMNTTLRPKNFPNLTAAIKKMYEASAATSTQFQTSNVSADKVIDKIQTEVKTEVLTKFATLDCTEARRLVFETNYVAQVVENYLAKILSRLKQNFEADNMSKILKLASYNSAIMAIEGQQKVVDKVTNQVIEYIYQWCVECAV